MVTVRSGAFQGALIRRTAKSTANALEYFLDGRERKGATRARGT